MNSKYLKYIDLSFENNELVIGRVYVEKTGGVRESVRVPYRNLYSLISKGNVSNSIKISLLFKSVIIA